MFNNNLGVLTKKDSEKKLINKTRFHNHFIYKIRYAKYYLIQPLHSYTVTQFISGPIDRCTLSITII